MDTLIFFIYKVVGFRSYDDYSILCNRNITIRKFCTNSSNNDVSKLGNTDFPSLVEGGDNRHFLNRLYQLRIIQIRNRLRI